MAVINPPCIDGCWENQGLVQLHVRENEDQWGNEISVEVGILKELNSLLL